MANKTEYSRLRLKRSGQTGVEPTIPTGTTIDNTWLPTDLLIGEGFLNTVDDRLWYRTNNGVVEVPLSGFSSSNYYTDSAFLSGNTIFFNRTDLPLAYSVDLTSIVSGTTDTNFANTDLTFTGNRVHDTDGNSLEITTDGGTYGEGYIYLDPTEMYIGVDGTYFYSDGTNAYTYANNQLSTISFSSGLFLTNYGRRKGYTALTTTTTLDDTHHVVNCTSGTFTINLPTSVSIFTAGQEYIIKNSGTGVITIQPDGTETIDGLATLTLNQNDVITIISDGTNWIKSTSFSVDTNTFTTGATLNGSVIEFDRNDLANAYNVDIQPALDNYLPLEITGNTLVTVDNSVLNFSGNSTSEIQSYVTHDIDNVTGLFIDEDAATLANVDLTDTRFYLVQASKLTGVRLASTFGPSTLAQIQITGSEIDVVGDSSFSGITYNGDYSLNFVNRSLVDKEYVDNVVSSSTFTGNTSASCITDLYISNLYGCSPITVHDDLDLIGKLYANTGNSELDLTFMGDDNVIFLGTTGSTDIVEGLLIDPDKQRDRLSIFSEDTINSQRSELNVSSTNTTLSTYGGTVDEYDSNIGTIYNPFANTISTVNSTLSVLGTASAQIRTIVDLTADESLITLTADEIEVNGNTNIIGSLSATTLYGDGSNLTGVSTEDNYVTGGTYNSITEELEFVGTNVATTFNVDVSALLDDTNTFTTGATLNGTVIEFDRNDLANAYNVDISSINTDNFTTGGTYNSITEEIEFVGTNLATTFNVDVSALLDDTNTFVTGGTYSTGTLTLDRNDSNQVTITGFTDNTDNFTTGGTYNSITEEIEFVGTNLATTFNVDVSALLDDTNTFTTGATLNGTVIEFDRNDLSNAYSVDISSINTDNFVTGGTFSTGTLTLDRQNGSVTITGFTSGPMVTSLTTGFGLSANTTTGDITILNTEPDQIVTLSASTGISTSGTYPNFTITNTEPDQIVTLSGGTDISVVGTYPNFTIDYTGAGGSSGIMSDSFIFKSDSGIVVGWSEPKIITDDTNWSGVTQIGITDEGWLYENIPSSSPFIDISNWSNSLLTNNIQITERNGSGFAYYEVTGITYDSVKEVYFIDVVYINGNDSFSTASKYYSLSKVLKGAGQDNYTTGATLNGTTLEFDRTDLANAYSVDLSSLATDYYVTGGTYSDGTLTLSRNGLSDVTVTGFTTGSTITSVPYDISFAISDEITPITSGTTKLTFFAPRAMTITNVYASVSTTGSTNSVFDINVNGSSILSTEITVESSEKHSKDATTQPVISSSSITQFDEITIDIDSAGTGATGAKIYIKGTTTP